MPRLDYETPSEPDGPGEIAPILRFGFGIVLPLMLFAPVAIVQHFRWDAIAALWASLFLLVVLSCYAFRNAFLKRQRHLPYIEERSVYLTIACGAITPGFSLFFSYVMLVLIPNLPQVAPNIPLLYFLVLPFSMLWPLVAPWVVFRGGRR